MAHYLRYLRIAFSATCLVACVLLVVLWVRSYWHQFVNPRIHVRPYGDELTYLDPQKRLWQTNSWKGTIWLNVTKQDPSWQFGPTIRPGGWKIYGAQPQLLGFGYLQKGRSASAIMPNWFAVLSFAALATLPWFRWRFSLRNLLIATTLVAVVMGAIVYLAR